MNAREGLVLYTKHEIVCMRIQLDLHVNIVLFIYLFIYLAKTSGRSTRDSDKVTVRDTPYAYKVSYFHKLHVV